MSNPETQEQTQPSHKIPITGRFDQYRSSYWAAMLAVLGVRYWPRSFFRNWNKEEQSVFYKKHAFSVTAGAIMEGVTGFFALRTYKDMNSILSQAVAWEFDKKKEDVGISDFRKSNNTMVRQTVDNYMKYNIRRALVNGMFFVPALGSLFLKLPGVKNLGIAKSERWNPDHWHGETGADWGLGALAAYLFSDVVGFAGIIPQRKMSPFEALQSMIDLKINHSDSISDEITGTDLLEIYERHAAAGMISSFIPKRNTPEWDRSMVIFNRMADLMNQTYKNTAAREYADFGIDDLIYMVGNKLIDPANVDRSLAYIEVSNRYDVPALKEVAKAVNSGTSLAEALQKYPVTLPEGKAASTEKKFADAVPPRSNERDVAAIPASLAEQVMAKRQKTDADLQLGQSA